MQIARRFKGKEAVFEREQNRLAWLAWHVAALPRQKRFPALRQMLTYGATPRRRQTPEEQWAIFQAMADASKARMN